MWHLSFEIFHFLAHLATGKLKCFMNSVYFTISFFPPFFFEGFIRSCFLPIVFSAQAVWREANCTKHESHRCSIRSALAASFRATVCFNSHYLAGPGSAEMPIFPVKCLVAWQSDGTVSATLFTGVLCSGRPHDERVAGECWHLFFVLPRGECAESKWMG